MKLNRQQKKQMCWLGALSVLACGAPIEAAQTNVTMRDPSTIVKRGDTYWVYGTGRGVQQYSSTDRLNWTSRGQVFASAPNWTVTAVPGNKGNIMWAPDIHQWNGKYYLYYSFSTLGSNNSAIGVATSATLQPDSWVDQGAVIISQRGGDFNAIDPSVILDEKGQPWMAYGSYWSGLKLTALDLKTGKRPANARVYNLATRPGVPGNAIEAPALYFRDGFYYAFINWGGGGGYNIRMGRAKTITGPYLDKSGRDLMQGGGSLFLTSVNDDKSGRPFDDQTGPGHVGVLREGDNYWVSTHYEWNRAHNGATTVNVNRLDWDADGWPRFVLDATPTKIVSILPTYGVLTASADGKALENTYFQNLPGQWWNLQYQSAGFYRVVSRDGERALSIVGDGAAAGTKVTLLPPANRDAQLWFLQQNEDGTYALLSKNSDKTNALDISGCSPNDGAAVNTWTKNDAPCQKWAFRTR